MKKCFKCGDTKPLTDFYKHPRMADGHLNKCKDCTKIDARLHRSENLEKIRAYDRERGRIEARQERNRLNYKRRTSTPEGRAAEWEKKRGLINLMKKSANNIVRRAIIGGKLTREPCKMCRSMEMVEAHHEDYAKPLDVVWL